MRVAASGFFDPLHAGHIEYLKLAKEVSENGELIVILNNDHQAAMKKGKAFMPLKDRVAVLEALSYVDEVVVAIDDDSSVCKTLEKVKPDIFTNGGDRNFEESPETAVCKRLGIILCDGLGQKIQSSSEIIKRWHDD